MLPYYETGSPKYLKVKYTVKILSKVLFMSLFSIVFLIFPHLLHVRLHLSLILPCSVFLGIVMYFKFSVLTGFLGKAKNGKEKPVAQWRILRPDEIDILEEKIDINLKDIYTYFGKNKKDWFSFKANFLEIHRKFLLYSSKSMHRIQIFDLIYYRILVLLVPVYKSVLIAAFFLFYLYMLLFILLTGTHSVPIDNLKNVAEALLIALLLSTIICGFKVILTPFFLKNFRRQFSFFLESAGRTEEWVALLNKKFS
ncbi:MAG: hypothetical protein D3924_00450 [Candidatus Electrothrix sp. AR4]|nr:hypothetical protein [Candidatus Electrothrix sp. AR4]